MKNVDGELAAVKALGSGWSTGTATIDSLSDDLASFLEDSAHVDSAGTPLPLGSIEYARYYQYNFVNLFRVRAAIALAEIGGPKATAVLDLAVAGYSRTPGDTLRGDAQLVVQRIRDSTSGGLSGGQGTRDGPTTR